MFKAVHYTLSNIKGTQKKFHIVEAGLFLFCTPLKVQMLLLDCYITRSFILEWFAVEWFFVREAGVYQERL